MSSGRDAHEVGRGWEERALAELRAFLAERGILVRPLGVNVVEEEGTEFGLRLGQKAGGKRFRNSSIPTSNSASSDATNPDTSDMQKPITIISSIKLSELTPPPRITATTSQSSLVALGSCPVSAWVV